MFEKKKNNNKNIPNNNNNNHQIKFYKITPQGFSSSSSSASTDHSATMKFLSPFVLGASLAAAHPRPGDAYSPRALYFLDSDPAGASVVSFQVNQDGGLGEPRRTSTGGKGLVGVNANGTVSADPLFSQDSVVVGGDRLFTVNAGSNTLASFHIPRHDPSRPVLLGEPVDTVGNVPSTVAYSARHGLACVANTGSRPGVQCFEAKPCGALKARGPLMPLPVANQTAPVTGPANTVSDILFNPSESALFVVLKGDGVADGQVYAYRVEDGEVVAGEPVVSRLAGVPVAFGTAFTSDASAVVSSPGFGGAFVDVSPDLAVTVASAVAVEGQAAICWAAYSEALGSVYLLDGGSPAVTALDVAGKSIGRTLAGYEAGMGSFDAVVAGNMLYALQTAPAIAIFDLEKPGDAPSVVDLAHLGERASWTGMAYYQAAQGY